MVKEIFEEQQYEGPTGNRVSVKDDEKASLEQLDFRRYPGSSTKFFYFFFLHLIYFHFLGPLTALMFVFTKKLRMLCYNLHLARFSLYSLEGLVCWLLSILLVMCQIANEHDDIPDMDVENATEKELIQYSKDNETFSVCAFNKFMIYLMRCVIIASKYSNLGPAKIEQYRRRKISKKEMQSQHILADWAE